MVQIPVDAIQLYCVHLYNIFFVNYMMIMFFAVSDTLTPG